MCFLPLKSSHYPSRPVPVPELFGKYPTRPVPKSKTPTRQTLVPSSSQAVINLSTSGHKKCPSSAKVVPKKSQSRAQVVSKLSSGSYQRVLPHSHLNQVMPK